MTQPSTQPMNPPDPGQAVPGQAPIGRRAVVAGGIALAVFALLAVGLVALVVSAPGRGEAGAQPSGNPADFAYASVKPAPPLTLTDQDGRPFDLAALRGRPVLIFFGYTHCPDVCPATVGVVNEALADVGPGPRAVFVSIDPERDDVAAMKSYLTYLPPAYSGLSGTPDEISRNAAAWNIKYAKIDEGSADGYGMAHTAGIFLVDGEGRLRFYFPFGTTAGPIAASLGELLAEAPPPTAAPATAAATTPAPPSTAPSVIPPATPAGSTPAPTPVVATQTPTLDAAAIRASVVSTSIWAGGNSPVILSLADGQGAPLDASVPVTVRITGADGAPAGPDVTARAVSPEGAPAPYFLADLDIPAPGSWQLEVRAGDGTSGSTPIVALDQGSTARLGGLAPDVDTPTLADTGGNLKPLTTVAAGQADPRFYTTSIADARAAGRPYVLVIDSNRFRVSQACGRAVPMVRYLLDRWPGVTFAHLEPFEYQVITEEPVLSGDIANPPLNSWTRAFGIGDTTWPATAMPWVFVVDGAGVVRAKYTGVVGSADVDVILTDITAGTQ